MQDDIVGVIDSEGNVVASYTYDTWGALLSSSGSMANINPLRYRGYYYDSDTGMYYLQSRYYDPSLKRFINADVYCDTGTGLLGTNMFAYCENNAVNAIDAFGNMSVKQIARTISTALIFKMFMDLLYQDLANGLLKVGLYVTRILTPITAKVFWWKPLAIIGIVVAAVAIVVALVIVYRNIQLNKIKKSISTKIKIGNDKINLKKFSKKPGSGPPRWIGPMGYELSKDLTEHKGPAYKLFRFGVRIATIALDGTILGKEVKTMTINDLLNRWNIHLPNDTYIFEYLLENKKSNCFYIDKLPFAVSRKNSYKFDQVDFFYQEVLEGEVNKEEFLRIEVKYRSVMQKLWLYNRFLVEFDVDTSNKYNINDVIDEEYQKYITSVFRTYSGSGLNEILDKDLLDFWTQIGVRDVASPIFYLEDFQMLLVPCWSCYIVYFNDLSKYYLVKDIVASEGLFLRHPKDHTVLT